MAIYKHVYEETEAYKGGGSLTTFTPATHWPLWSAAFIAETPKRQVCVNKH